MVPVLLFGAGIAVGLGVAALAPGLMPQIARAARPTAKEALKTAFIGYAQFRRAAAEAGEAASDLMAEVGHEVAAEPTAEAPPASNAVAAAAGAAARAVAAARGTSDG